jgi:hypothetical protein
MNVTELSADTLDVAGRPLRAPGIAAPRMAADRGVDSVAGGDVTCADTISGRRSRVGWHGPVEVVRA